MPLVLVQNPVIVNQGYDWKDIVGQQYHFPNQYKNRCVPGVPFVYYRGTRRLGGKRATPEYFGHGRIGEVWRDESIPLDRPKKDWAWYCNIIDYVPFQKPVPAKINGSFLEQIARNHWSVGIRPLTTELFNRILELAGCQSFEAAQHVDEIALPDIGSITVTEADQSLLVPKTTRSAIGTGNSNGSRHSRFSRPVGRRAEEIAQRFLQTNADQLGARRIRWVSQAGLYPRVGLGV
jgi:hypothetical protein